MFKVFFIISAVWLLFMTIPCLIFSIMYRRDYSQGVEEALNKMVAEKGFDVFTMTKEDFVNIGVSTVEQMDEEKCFVPFMKSVHLLRVFFVALAIFVLLVAATVVMGVLGL